VLQRVIQFGRREEAGLIDQIADAAVEALDHAIGLGMSRRAQPVFDPRGLAGQVEYMLSRRDSAFTREAVGELAPRARTDEPLIVVCATQTSTTAVWRERNKALASLTSIKGARSVVSHHRHVRVVTARRAIALSP
jgi:hypothetical protein